MNEMHNAFIEIGAPLDIDSVYIDPKPRDDIQIVLQGLKHLVTDPALRVQLVVLLKEEPLPEVDRLNSQPTMIRWQALVMATLLRGVRKQSNIHMLHDYVNKDQHIRGVLGQDKFGITYELQDVINYVKLIHPTLLKQLGHLVVQSDHDVARKKAWRVIAKTHEPLVVEADVT